MSCWVAIGETRKAKGQEGGMAVEIFLPALKAFLKVHNIKKLYLIIDVKLCVHCVNKILTFV